MSTNAVATQFNQRGKRIRTVTFTYNNQPAPNGDHMLFLEHDTPTQGVRTEAFAFTPDQWAKLFPDRAGNNDDQ